ncbi:MAG: hypothetical protein ABH837_02735 [bacterium]
MLDIDPNKQSRQQQAPTQQSWNSGSVPTPQTTPKERTKSGSNIAGSMLFIGTLAIFIVLTGAGVWGLVYYKNQEISQVTSDISDTDIKIAKLKNIEQEALALQAQYDNVSTVLDERQIWTELIRVLGDETLKKAVFSSFDVQDSEQNSITLSGTTDSLTSLAKLIVAFQNSENFSNISVSSFSPPSTENPDVSFGINLKYDKSIISPEKDKNATTE